MTNPKTLAEMCQNVEWMKANREAFVVQFALERGREIGEGCWLARIGKKFVIRRRLGKEIVELYARFGFGNAIEQISRGGMPQTVREADEHRIYMCMGAA